MTGKGSIMVLDDDADVTLLLEEVLIGEGYSVRRCGWNPTVETIARRRPDALIVDLNPLRPDATLLLLDELRGHPATRAVAALVVCTDAHLLATVSEPLRHLGCSTLIKPFDLDEIIDGVAWLMATAAVSRAGTSMAREFAGSY